MGFCDVNIQRLSAFLQARQLIPKLNSFNNLLEGDLGFNLLKIRPRYHFQFSCSSIQKNKYQDFQKNETVIGNLKFYSLITLNLKQQGLQQNSASYFERFLMRIIRQLQDIPISLAVRSLNFFAQIFFLSFFQLSTDF